MESIFANHPLEEIVGHVFMKLSISSFLFIPAVVPISIMQWAATALANCAH